MATKEVKEETVEAPKEDLVLLHIPRTSEEQADEVIFVNNRSWLIKLDEDVYVPACVKAVYDEKVRQIKENWARKNALLKKNV